MTRFIHDVITGRNNSPLAWALQPLLWLLSVIYAAVGSGIRSFYAWGILKARTLGRPVISIGNITSGGTGKTPFAIYLARTITVTGKKPVILMRGYMSVPGTVSDEALMIRRQLSDVPVYADPDRVKSAEESLRRDHPDVFILDDGFQHRKVRRDLEIVLIDAVNPFGNGGMLPLGILREPKAQLCRADLLVITRSDLVPDRIPELCRELSDLNPRAGIVQTAHVPVGVEEPFADAMGHAGALSMVSGRVCVCSAIGSPEGFAATLKNLGADIVHHEIFIDHHIYHEEDVQRLVALCRSKKVDRLVTTQKDIVKLKIFKDAFQEIRLLAVAITVKVLKGENEISSRLHSVLHS